LPPGHHRHPRGIAENVKRGDGEKNGMFLLRRRKAVSGVVSIDFIDAPRKRNTRDGENKKTTENYVHIRIISDHCLN
jgi:hypothetical protein